MYVKREQKENGIERESPKKKKGKIRTKYSPKTKTRTQTSRKFWFDCAYVYLRISCIVKLFPECSGSNTDAVVELLMLVFNQMILKKKKTTFRQWNKTELINVCYMNCLKWENFAHIICSYSCRHHLITIYSLDFLISIFILLTTQL